MRTKLIIFLIVNCIVKSIGEDPQASASTTDNENPTSSLENGVEGLVKIVHGFLETVQSEDFVGEKSGAISFNDVEKIIKDEDFGELANRWRDFVAVFGGFAACVVIGLLFMLCMPVAGCITCCCFCCCKRCGKATSKEDPKNAKCKRVTFTTILFILSLLMLVGAIFSVISNEILHSKFENVNQEGPVGQVQLAFDGLIKFADNTAEEFENQANKTVESTVEELINKIDDSTTRIVHDIKATINATYLLQKVEDLGINANRSAESLIKVTEEVKSLKNTGSDVKNKLFEIKDDVQMECPSNTAGCPNVDALVLNVDFSPLDDLTDVNTAVQAVTDISNEAEKAKKEFDGVQDKIESEINSTIKDAKDQTLRLKDDTLKEIPKAKKTLLDMTSSLYINDTLDSLNKDLKEYGDYVWYAFIGLPCLILLVVMFYLLGLMFGLFGERPGPGAPCCNKGAGSNLLCCGVTCSYIVGSLIMLIVILMFIPAGLLYTNGCRYLNDGVENVNRIEFIVNSTLGYNVAEFIDKDNKSPNITVSNILRNCKANLGLYNAFYLENLFSIDDVLNMSQITAEINKIISEGSGTNLGIIDIIPADLKKQLEDFSKSGIDNINFTQYDNVLNKDLTSIDLTDLEAQLQIAANASEADGNATRATFFRQQAEEVLNVSNKLKQIEQSRGNLSEALTHLRDQSNLTVQVQDLVDSLEKAQYDFNTGSKNILDKSLNATAKNLSDTVHTKISEIKTTIKNLGPCKDVYDNVQKLSDAVCVSVLDPVNSIWFGLGWGLAFFIPAIIFALCTANLYQREEPYDTSFHRTRKLLKKKNKEESTFDNPDIDMYQGQGYDAYNGQGADNIPLTGMRHDQVRTRGDGVPNQGYYSPEHRDSRYPDHHNSGYPEHRNSGYNDRSSNGYPYDHAPSSPPPYNGHGYEDEVHGRARAYRKPQY